MALYLGLDSSTQSLTAILLEDAGGHRRIAFESSLSFDETFPEYGTRHGVLPVSDPMVAVSSPVMWAHALETMMGRIAASGIDLSRLAAISGSAQQHGSVYLNAASTGALAALDAERPLAGQVERLLSRPVAPIWMDSSTSVECREIAAAVGGDTELARHTGSRAFERFTGPQIRKFSKQDPAGYAATHRVHLVSSFLASLLIGGHSPIDPGDGSGMNLMDLRDTRWWSDAVRATAPHLEAKLPGLAPSVTVVGTLAPYWQTRFGLPPAKIVAWSGDNPCSLIGTGLVREGRVAVSLGTSDTIFGLMREPRVDATGTGHVFGSPTGDFMGLTVFKNGSLARERIRDECRLSWVEFSRVLQTTPPGNNGRILLPWFEPEITPAVLDPGIRRYGLRADDGPGHVRAVIEAQMMALAQHARWMDVRVDTIHATGGAAANREILQVMADVFGAEVYQFTVGNSACLGAALRAVHADALSNGRPIGWEDVVKDLAQPVAASRIAPDPSRHALYGELQRVYAACEAHALRGGPDPSALLEAFRVQSRAASGS
jgi:xylulokinase